MPDGSAEAEDLDLVIKETKRCAAIIRRLLDFAREKTPEKKFSDINELIIETTRLIGQSAQVEDIEIIMDLDKHLPAIWIDEDLIRQVFMNIMVNAQHAIEGEGSITIRTRYSPEHQSADAGGGIVPDGSDFHNRYRLRHTGRGFAAYFRPHFSPPRASVKALALDCLSVMVLCTRMVENSKWTAWSERERDFASIFRSEHMMAATMGARNERANTDR